MCSAEVSRRTVYKIASQSSTTATLQSGFESVVSESVHALGTRLQQYVVPCTQTPVGNLATESVHRRTLPDVCVCV